MDIVSNSGVLINYEVIGEGYPIVMIHGIHGSLQDWKIYGYPKLLSNYQLILIDLRGHGNSSKVYDPDLYDPKIQASDIRAVLKDLSIQRAHIWGYSYGARTAFAMAIYFPNYVSGLYVGALHPYPVFNILHKIKDRQKLLKIGLEVYLAEMNPGYTKEQITLFLKNDQVALIQMDESIINWEGFGDDLNRLKNVEFPIILYLGSKDRSYLELADTFFHDFPNTKKVMLEGYRHFDVFTNAKIIVEAIQEYF